jgi:hypothetical protein
MRTAQEIRTHLLDYLKSAVLRPLMHGGNDVGVELCMSYVIDELSFIDEREFEWERARDGLIRRGQFSSKGVVGSFHARIAPDHDFGAEVASVCAAAAHQLGYFPLHSTLSAADFRRLRTGLRAACRACDRKVSDVIARFGPPCLQVRGTVLVYFSASDLGSWICFDFDPSSAAWSEYYYRLRNARIPAKTFARELTFTPHGRNL